jgi:5'-nucleotidase
VNLVSVVGTVAALSTTGAFVPQILKIRKQGGNDLSYAMLSVYLGGVLLWLAYGLMFHAPAVIWANGVAAVLVSTALVMKASFKPGPRVDRGSPEKSAGRLRVAVDMDEVIADSFGRHLSIYNQLTGERIDNAMIGKRGIAATIPAGNHERFHRIPHESGFFADLDVMPGSQRALELLSAHYDVFITSAAMEVPSSFDAKFKWLQRHFPFIPVSHIVFCGDKGIINADYLIDDNSRHFKAFRGTGILFTAPHNTRENAVLRANNWEEVLAILQVSQPLPDRVPSSNVVDTPIEVSA